MGRWVGSAKKTACFKERERERERRAKILSKTKGKLIISTIKLDLEENEPERGRERVSVFIRSQCDQIGRFFKSSWAQISSQY